MHGAEVVDSRVPMCMSPQDAELVRDRLRRELAHDLEYYLLGKALTRHTVQQAISICVRILRPYLRNRYSIVNNSSQEDLVKGELFICAKDHADGKLIGIDELIDGIPNWELYR